MKTETQQWLDKVIPLLVHLREGGEVRYADDGKLLHNTSVPYFCLLTRPDLYSIHVEPRVIYINECNGAIGLSAVLYCSEERARLGVSHARIRPVRFIEDLNWKPESNPPTNPDHTPPHEKPI